MTENKSDRDEEQSSSAIRVDSYVDENGIIVLEISFSVNFLFSPSPEDLLRSVSHTYIDQAGKPVPIFLVIAPDFTDDSEAEALRYHASHFDRNIALITAKELKDVAEEWSSDRNRKREEPFPLGLLASTGRFSRPRLGKLA